MTKEFRYITAPEAADLLGVSQMQITRMIRDGKITGAFKFGYVWALPRKEIEKIQKQKETKTDE